MADYEQERKLEEKWNKVRVFREKKKENVWLTMKEGENYI